MHWVCSEQNDVFDVPTPLDCCPHIPFGNLTDYAVGGPGANGGHVNVIDMTEDTPTPGTPKSAGTLSAATICNSPRPFVSPSMWRHVNLGANTDDHSDPLAEVNTDDHADPPASPRTPPAFDPFSRAAPGAPTRKWVWPHEVAQQQLSDVHEDEPLSSMMPMIERRCLGTDPLQRPAGSPARGYQQMF
jgi:hypothetical protein